MTSMYPYHRYFDPRGQYGTGGGSGQYDYSQLQQQQQQQQQQPQHHPQQQQHTSQETTTSPRTEHTVTDTGSGGGGGGSGGRQYDACLLAGRTSANDPAAAFSQSGSGYPQTIFPARSESSTSEADTTGQTDDYKEQYKEAYKERAVVNGEAEKDSNPTIPTQQSVIMRRPSAGGGHQPATKPTTVASVTVSDEQARTEASSYTNGQCSYDSYTAKQAYHNNHHHLNNHHHHHLNNHHHLHHHHQSTTATSNARYPLTPQAGYTSVIVDAQQYHNGYVH
jgi:hypothetical protein